MKKVYPIVITEEDGVFFVTVPDFNINTEGTSVVNAIEMARDAIGLTGITLEDMGKEIPLSNKVKVEKEKENDIITLVDIDFSQYRNKVNNKVVKKNCTLPQWLSQQAEEQGINFSKVLQDALMQIMDIKKNTMSLRIKCLFGDILNNLKANEIKCSDMSKICLNIRDYSKEFTIEQKRALLEIPYIVLKDMCELKKDEKKWSEQNSGYFRGNLVGKNEFVEKYKTIFAQSYGLDELKDYAEDILKSEEYYNNDFYLRNIEIVLRDDVRISNDYHMNKAIILGKYLENILK